MNTPPLSVVSAQNSLIQLRQAIDLLLARALGLLEFYRGALGGFPVTGLCESNDGLEGGVFFVTNIAGSATGFDGSDVLVQPLGVSRRKRRTQRSREFEVIGLNLRLPATSKSAYGERQHPEKEAVHFSNPPRYPPSSGC